MVAAWMRYAADTVGCQGTQFRRQLTAWAMQHTQNQLDCTQMSSNWFSRISWIAAEMMVGDHYNGMGGAGKVQ